MSYWESVAAASMESDWEARDREQAEASWAARIRARHEGDPSYEGHQSLRRLRMQEEMDQQTDRQYP